ncbi:ATP-binding cassette domain-containing protein [Kordiimonas sp. SCSIO 12603]|uniref:ATP-binding cassette domain-containing protein n=1 Tax=Kordiimonas sp. SCSIO 12603 TaxID=2829596 RepID=UPI0021033AE1|nr:ATP-binding cassette domain-containing protein [Kordiimonas sp. SCSIO 12603]UTW58933.1 ATP-binding cassette domain-containing protein [Kordiimonas sp. SCSIO 12603]
MLKLDNVSKRYKKRLILNDVSCEFNSGLNLLVGPSGAGKSTLLRMCATVEKPTSGQLWWYDKPYAKVKRKLRYELGYAPQIVDLPLDVTGREFLEHMAALKAVGEGAKVQITELLEQLGLSHDADQRIIGWSGGMRRRLILAQAFLGAPKLLALDEPTAELDTDTATRVAELIAHAAQSATILLTTHLVDHFDSIGANIVRVADGGVHAT